MERSNCDGGLVHPVGLLVLSCDPDVEQPEEREDQPQVFEHADEHFMVENLAVQVQDVD